MEDSGYGGGTRVVSVVVRLKTVSMSDTSVVSSPSVAVRLTSKVSTVAVVSPVNTELVRVCVVRPRVSTVTV